MSGPGQSASRPTRDNPEVWFGHPETAGRHVERFVDVPAVFLAAPRRELPVQERMVPDVRYRRYETWYEGDRQMGRWSWVTFERMLAEKSHRNYQR